MTPSVSTIVLAAGESTRMGTQKAMLLWQGIPLVEYQLRQLADVSVIHDVVVVTGHDPEPVEEIASRFPHVSVVRNASYRTGKVSSMLAALRRISAETPAIMLLAVDQPRSSQVLRTIVEAHVSAGSLITLPAHKGRRGHPPIFSRALLPELRTITEEARGVRAVVAAHEEDICCVECGPGALVDLNRPSDLASGTSPAGRA